ncbi:hypothetical protein [Arthrobacter silvisoli]|uniref:hypothetical protein n=1 Tax=Arthrobacter silvisoli TaxID=2291022 RepID=UPI000E218572|nr:hypothetical protein [Arthrobacter silvisoli]
MATNVRVLLYDHQPPGKEPTSVSLLQQLGLKDKLKFVDTSLANTTVLVGAPNIQLEYELEDGSRHFASMGQDGLVAVLVEEGRARYVASLRQVPGRKDRLPFESWWTNPIMDLPNRGRYSRWELIRQMANRAGGAHVDPKGLEEGYARFVNEGLAMWVGTGTSHLDPLAEGHRPTGDPAAMSMRQIAYELLATMEECEELQSVLRSAP